MDCPIIPAPADIARLVQETLGFMLPAECVAGVQANLLLLAEHVRQLDRPPP